MVLYSCGVHICSSASAFIADRCLLVHRPCLPLFSSRPLASCPALVFFWCVFCARARAAMASPSDHLACFAPKPLIASRIFREEGYVSDLVPMAEAQAQKQAQRQDDDRRLCHHLEDVEPKLDTLEGRSCAHDGHDLRLQYLEAPPPFHWCSRSSVPQFEFWRAKDNGFQAAKSVSSAAFLQELRHSGGATINHLLDGLYFGGTRFLRDHIRSLLCSGQVVPHKTAMGIFFQTRFFVYTQVIRVIVLGIGGRLGDDTIRWFTHTGLARTKATRGRARAKARTRAKAKIRVKPVQACCPAKGIGRLGLVGPCVLPHSLS